ncbi:hypothetical protein Daus18300_002862 [Diaporthe australafricana]|uniref:Uncharacterized protein n=1 Tax=Diaporthe australafricana TaxID=127596 RepID=A0ABR3XJU8_9PEZI
MSSPAGETKGIFNFIRTTKPLIKPTTPTSPRARGGPAFEGPPTPPRTPRTPRNLPSQTPTPNHRLPETPASASVPGNTSPTSPQSKDILAPPKSRSSVSKASRPRGSTITGETKKSQSTVVGHKVPKATVARVSTIIRVINKIRKDETQRNDEESKSWPLSPDELDYLISRIQRNRDKELPEYFNEQLR